MGNDEIIRAWKDREYRDSLDEQEQEQVPENPAGAPLSNEELEQVDGSGTVTITYTTATLTTLVPGTEWTTATATTVATTVQ